MTPTKPETNPPFSRWSLLNGLPVVLGMAAGFGFANGSFGATILGTVSMCAAFVLAGIVYERFVRHG